MVRAGFVSDVALRAALSPLSNSENGVKDGDILHILSLYETISAPSHIVDYPKRS